MWLPSAFHWLVIAETVLLSQSPSSQGCLSMLPEPLEQLPQLDLQMHHQAPALWCPRSQLERQSDLRLVYPQILQMNLQFLLIHSMHLQKCLLMRIRQWSQMCLTLILQKCRPLSLRMSHRKCRP